MWLIREKEKWAARRSRRKGRIRDAWLAARASHMHPSGPPIPPRSGIRGRWQDLVATVRRRNHPAPSDGRGGGGSLVYADSCRCSSYNCRSGGTVASPRSRARSDAASPATRRRSEKL